jgi:hypothetical protein
MPLHFAICWLALFLLSRYFNCPALARTPLQANWLRAQGVKKGDCVAIYMPMICELPIAMVSPFSPISASQLADTVPSTQP